MPVTRRKLLRTSRIAFRRRAQKKQRDEDSRNFPGSTHHNLNISDHEIQKTFFSITATTYNQKIPPPFVAPCRNNSSQNATKHGCCSETVLILKSESLADYKALEATWFKAYNPKQDPEKRLVQELVNADWLSERANRAMINFESQLFNENPNPMDWTEDQLKRLALLTRYKTARNNAAIKARRAI